jgi:hypothetical protein
MLEAFFSRIYLFSTLYQLSWKNTSQMQLYLGIIHLFSCIILYIQDALRQQNKTNVQIEIKVQDNV